MDNEIITTENIRAKIYEIRGQKVMLDRDLAALYGVETKVLKQSVKRNPLRFPIDAMFELSTEEFNSLRSQFVTSNGRGGVRYMPYAFTETGMARVLKAASEVSCNWFRNSSLLRRKWRLLQNLWKKNMKGL